MNKIKSSLKNSLQYSFKPLGFGVYLATLVGSLLLVFLRHNEALNQLPLIGEWQIGLHIYNFAISLLLVVMIGGLWALMGVRRWYQLLLPAGFMIIVNIIYEFLLPFLNVRDPLDALYGAIGSTLGFLLVLLIARFGVKPVPRQ